MTKQDPLLTGAHLRKTGAMAHPTRTSLRDPRLDFFRGVTMFIILIAHVPNNWWALWIPARFGFSDATEVFVFCSGMASALAFGRVFRERGLAMGTARVAFRVWQVYWAHVALFLAIAAAMVALNGTGAFETDYVGQLNLHRFFDAAEAGVLSLLTLTYVPNYFDILPMYLAILAMMPIVVALARVEKGLALAFVVTVWLGANLAGWALPAEPWSDREWFFNPFGWQLVFFTGFALMMGWLPAPPVRRDLIALAVLLLLATVPFAYFRIVAVLPEVAAWRKDWGILIQKTDFGILRYLHFLALAYLGWVAVGPKGRRLLPPEGGRRLARIWGATLRIIMKVGQQSLAVFVASMFLAQLLGVVLDQTGRNGWTILAVNLLGFALIVGVAYTVGWFKSHPWRTKGGPASD